MFLTFFVFFLVVTLFLFAGLAFHLSLMRGAGFRTWIARSASAADARQTARLHAAIFQEGSKRQVWASLGTRYKHLFDSASLPRRSRKAC